MKPLLLICCILFSNHAASSNYDDEFNTLWESLWSQGGSPQEIVRWPSGVVKVRYFGVNLNLHRPYVFKALAAATEYSGVKFEDISDQADAAQVGQLHIEVVANNGNVEPNMPCYVQTQAQRNWELQRVVLRMRDDSAYRCIFHEMMHAMGVKGHPTGKTVLGYFQGRRDIFLPLDQVMLRAWYTPKITAGMTPLEAIGVLTDVFARDGDVDTALKLAAREKYLAKQVNAMRDFALGNGEPPTIVIRSGRISIALVNEGRLRIAWYLGRAYQFGHIVTIDLKEAQTWYAVGANKGHSGSQFLLARLFETQNDNPTAIESAYYWYGLASNHRNMLAQAAQNNLKTKLSKETLEKLDGQILEFRAKL